MIKSYTADGNIFHKYNTLIGEDGTDASDARPLDFEVRLLTKILSIIFPIIRWPIVWLRCRFAASAALVALVDGDGIPTIQRISFLTFFRQF